MKVLHITATHLNPTGGVPVVLRELVNEQNKIQNVEANVLSINAPVDQMNSPYFYFLGNKKIGTFLKNYKPEIVVIHSFYHPEYASVAHELIKLKVPFVIEPHGSFGHMAMSKSHLKKIVANNTVFHSLIHKASAYIFTNNAEKEDTVYHAPMEFVIPNGVLREEVENAALKKMGTTANPVFYYLGRYDIHHKGLDYLFDALDLLESEKESINIIFYGTGSEEEIKYVRSRVNSYSIVKAREAGTIFGEEKKRALEEAHILVLTSRYEGSPMTILDALTYGNPCLVTPGTNVADEMVDNHTGWKTELDAESIAQTILSARNDYINQGSIYYTNCKRYVLENYSWDKLAAASVDVLRKVILKQN